MRDVMERINLNVPRDVRKALREVATEEGRTEAEVARSLLVAALERRRRDAFYRAFADSYTPQMRARDLKFLKAFERLRG